MLISQLLLAIVTFVITNIDDLLILSLYFASGKYKNITIVSGQYLGIAVLVLISLLGLLLGSWIDERWLSLLGLLPIFLGARDLVSNNDSVNENEIQVKSKLQLVNVALVTIANGGDNVGVYAPLFATADTASIILYIAVFAVMTGCWCLIGYYAVAHPLVKITFARYGKIALPYFLILLGLYILSGLIE